MFEESILKKIAITLFGIVVILLISNIIVKKINDKGEQPKNREALSGYEINSIFFTALKNYGFSDSWIIKAKLKDIKDDSLFAAYSVKVPKNLPIHLLLLEMRDLFWNDDVEIQSEEITSSNKTILRLSSEKHTKLAAEFSYDDKILREFGTVSFLVNNIPIDNELKVDELLKTPELYYVVFPPADASKKLAEKFVKAGKRYAIYLDDNISELNYKLDPGYSEDRLKKSIREIVGTFYNAAFFIVDDKSDLFKSEKFKFLENEFRKRNIRIFNKSSFNTLGDNSINIDGKFQDFMLNLNKKDEKVLLVSADDFLSIVNLIPSYRKIGYKFIYPGDIIMRK